MYGNRRIGITMNISEVELLNILENCSFTTVREYAEKTAPRGCFSSSDTSKTVMILNFHQKMLQKPENIPFSGFFWLSILKSICYNLAASTAKPFCEKRYRKPI